MGQQANGSPTEAVLQDFIARSFSVDDLYCIMRDMGYVEGMKILQEYSQLQRERQRDRERKKGREERENVCVCDWV